MSTKNGTYETCASYSNLSIVSRIHKIRIMGSLLQKSQATTINATKIVSDVSPIILLDTTMGDKKILGFYGWRQPHHVVEPENFLGRLVNIFLCNFYIYYQI